MRVLFLSQIVPYPPHGGVLQRGYHVLRELGRRASVDLLAFVHPDELNTPEKIEESRRVLGGFCERVEYFDLWPKKSKAHTAAAIATSAVSGDPFSVIAHRSGSFQQRVSDLMRAAPYDVVHVDTVALSGFLFSNGNAQAGAASVLTHHNVESMLMERRAQVETRTLARQFLRREAAKLRRFEARTSPKFDMNIVVSEKDGELLAERAPGVRTRVVPNGVDVDYFAPSTAPQEQALIYTGGLNMFANRDAVMHFLTEIWPLVREKVPGARFYAVGQEPPRELVAFAERDPQVVVTGFVDDIRPYVEKAAVYVVPLRVGGGTRLKVLDSMASGKALVSTTIGCEGIDVRPGEHLEIADTPETFARATVTLLGDPERRRVLGAAARGLVEQRYAWQVIGDQLMQAYEGARTGGRQGR